MTTQGQNIKESWQSFELNDLLDESEKTTGPYLKFLDVKSMSMGLYMLPKDAKDKQQPHKLDESYYIISGKAILQVEEDEIPVKAGSTIFVKADIPHSFIRIEEDLTILVFFSTGPTN
jgi:quercetin dioxygenase-like cupin family protein